METSSPITPNPSVHQFRDLGKNLLEAAKNGDDSEVRELLTKGASFTTDWLGTSPLHLAAQYGHLSTAQLLMRAGMSWDARTKVNKTPLHLATQFGHIDLAKAFINQGTDLNARDMLNMTPLHWSAANNQPDIAALLISSGADAKLRNKFDKTAEDICIETGNLKVLELLNKQYTDVPIKETVTSSGNGIPEPLDIVGGEAEKTSEAASSSLLASLSALVNMSTESSNGIVTVEDLARLQAGQITQQSVPIENIRSIILTDAGRLAMQLWNKELEQRVNFPLDKGECEDIQSKTKMDSETSEDREQNYQANQYLTSTLQSDKLSSTLCGREDPITTPSSSVIQPLNFSPNFLDFSNRRLSEPDDNYMLDLDRDILQNQFENARKSNNNSPVKKDIGKLGTPKLSVSAISKKL